MRSFPVVIVSVFAAVVATGGTAYLAHRVLPAKAQTKQSVVPELVGLSEADARGNVEASGLVMLVGGREANEELEPGTVIRQTPPAGQQVPAGGSVTLTLSKAMSKVPGVVGRSVEEVHLVTDRETGRARGFAFVTMATGAEAAHAIAQLNNAMFEGRPLRVNVAEERSARGSGNDRNARGGHRGW